MIPSLCSPSLQSHSRAGSATLVRSCPRQPLETAVQSSVFPVSSASLAPAAFAAFPAQPSSSIHQSCGRLTSPAFTPSCVHLPHSPPSVSPPRVSGGQAALFPTLSSSASIGGSIKLRSINGRSGGKHGSNSSSSTGGGGHRSGRVATSYSGASRFDSTSRAACVRAYALKQFHGASAERADMRMLLPLSLPAFPGNKLLFPSVSPYSPFASPSQQRLSDSVRCCANARRRADREPLLTHTVEE
ncbi:unnamed protein product [Closterium sp. Naga37s-1]|nr:unnamed protein product [Closterium sp. Naga37s-1]